MDSGVKAGDTISPKFDSLMGKLVVTAQNRATAVARVRRALGELRIEGVPSPASLFEQIFDDPEFTAEQHPFSVSTKWLERKYLNREPAAAGAGQPASLAGASSEKPAASDSFFIEVNDKRVKLTVPQTIVDGLTGAARVRSARRATQPLRGQGLHDIGKPKVDDGAKSGIISSPMQAIVTRVNVAEGQSVTKGDLLVVLESMKMENYVYAPVNGTVKKICVGPADGVDGGQTLVELDIHAAEGAQAASAASAGEGQGTEGDRQ